MEKHLPSDPRPAVAALKWFARDPIHAIAVVAVWAVILFFGLGLMLYFASLAVRPY